jgi:hypothetical protein
MEHKLTFEQCIKGKDQIQDMKSTNVVVLIMLNKNLINISLNISTYFLLVVSIDGVEC